MLVMDKGEGSSQPLFSENRLRQARNDPGLRGVLPLDRGGQGGLAVARDRICRSGSYAGIWVTG
jgi:hypothetical protein